MKKELPSSVDTHISKEAGYLKSVISDMSIYRLGLNQIKQ